MPHRSASAATSSSPPPAVGVRRRSGHRARQPVTARVGHLDTEGVTDDVERQPEVPAGHAAVRGGVGGEFPDDQFRRVQRQSPGAQLFSGQLSREPGAAWCGGQLRREVRDGGGDFLVHITQSGRACYL
ncbi:hypothetical protein GCM10017687_73240 [Streptomyces echinatus]